MQHFWPAVTHKSWLLEVNGASHNTFLRASWLVEKALDLLCKRGPTSHEVNPRQNSAHALAANFTSTLYTLYVAYC